MAFSIIKMGTTRPEHSFSAKYSMKKKFGTIVALLITDKLQ